ncbi:DUF4302 domain-containing protein [Pedobacter frigoris]|uniref:DUF4302 domain-containing protein n=1 Tax=Pedobacter frigoris TaxID=2571272 RepID=A0A4U1CCZ1_9SPHI|nr:DUF4302 domain-containing protein [Pedobacter frigoris]TKC03932.1 DUF4302 domain-containing protein [Pedobacter frigoris]
MKTIYKITFFIAIMAMLASCKKDELLDGSQAKSRANALEKEFKTQLHNSKDGWVLFITTTNPDIKTAVPLILKFDTALNKVSVKSIYGNEDRTTYFNISAATGMPLFSFATGSIISDIYEIGGTNVTDYFFKVLSVSKDVIELQSYRKGTASASEGGAIFRMVKNENLPWVKDWEQETIKLFAQTRFFGFYLNAEMTYASGDVFTPARVYFLNQSAGNVTFLKANYPTISNNKTVDAVTFGYAPPVGAAQTPLAMMGYNSIFYESTLSFTPASLFSTGPQALMKLFKTNYFLIRKINTSSIDVFALDKDGKEIITGKISL